MEPDTVSTPKINRNTFKIGSGDLQQQVASNTKRIRVISTMLRSSRRGRNVDGLTPQATNIQQNLEQSNLILADIAIQLQQDFDNREQIEKRLLQKNKEDQLELRRRNKEEDIEFKKTEKKITKSTKKIKGPLDGLFKTIGKILLLFGGLVLIKTLLTPGAVSKILNSEKWQQAKTILDVTFQTLADNMKIILGIGAAILGLKLVSTIAAIFAVGKGFLALLANPLILAGIGILYALAKQGLGSDEKEVIQQLEEMGGFSKENREALAQKYEERLANMNVLERMIHGAEYKDRIHFLRTGEYGEGFGGAKKKFDFSKIDQLSELNDFENFMLNFDTDTTNINNELGKPKGDKITKIEVEGETIDLRENKKIETTNNQSATSTPNIASVDTSNYKIKDFAKIAGFNESVYT